MLKMNDLMNPVTMIPRVQAPSYDTIWKLFRPRGQIVKIDMSPGGVLLKGKKDGSAIYIYLRGVYSGKIVNGVATIYVQQPEHKIITDFINEIEKDPLATVMKYGLSTGRCCICSRELTDETSVKEGIGPICRRYFPS